MSTPTLQKAKQNLATSFRLCTIEGVVAIPLVSLSLPVNVVLSTLFVKVYALPNALIGLLAALPFVANFLQVGVTPFIARWHSPKLISLLAGSFQALGWVGFLVLLQLIPPGSSPHAGKWFVVWFAYVSLCGSICGVSWSVWVQEWVPSRLRGKFFGYRNRFLQSSSLCFWLLAGWLISKWDYALIAFQVLAAGAIVLRLVSIYLQLNMPTASRFGGGARRTPFGEQVRILLRAKSFLGYMAFGMIWSFAANCFGPFYYVFMLQELNLSAFEVGILTTLSALGGALSMPGWGRCLDRFGNKAVMTVSLVFWQLQNFVWCFLTPANSHLLYLMWIWGGISSAGFVLGVFTLQLKLMPIPAKNLAIGCNLALTSLVAAIAPTLGGFVLESWIDRGANPLTVYHWCFALQPVLAIIGTVVLLRIKEPAASTFKHVLGAMRNIRTLSGIFGLGFLVDYIFYRPDQRR